MRLTTIAIAASIGGIACLGVAASARAQGYQQLYSFSGGSGDSDPVAGLTSFNGRLFGTSQTGGASGYGTLFEFSPASGTGDTIHVFQGGSDGVYPESNLIPYDGLLYGTTEFGDAADAGIVFALNPRTNAETVLHAFSGNDGDNPFAGLLNVAGTFYGTTFGGGSAGGGTAFAVDPATGAETVIYSFAQGQTDGKDPVNSLIEVNGLLYGTTAYGGLNGDGTIFSIHPRTGIETVLASFKKHESGFYPRGALIDVGGKLYGTASGGAAPGAGTIFSFDLSTGAFKTIYRFQDGSDGAGPDSALISLHGILYGVTNAGGGATCGRYTCGTVFSFNIATKTEKVLYAFKGGKDGSFPQSSLTAVRGVLYGTTSKGGTANAGTIFKILP